MDMKNLLDTNFGKLSIDPDPSSGFRRIDFKNGALTVSGLNVSSVLYSRHTPQPDHTPRNFEKYLLNDHHEFEFKDAEEFVNRVGLSENFPKYFWLVIRLNDSETTQFKILICSKVSLNGKRTYGLQVDGNKATRLNGVHSWDLPVKANTSILVTAFQAVCFLAKRVYENKFPTFISKLKLIDRY